MLCNARERLYFHYIIIMNRDKIIKLIHLYKMKPELWDPADKNYTLKNVKQDAWAHIAQELNMDLESVKSKVLSLLSSFRREKAKICKSAAIGKGADEVYKSTWFAFKHLTFLLDRGRPKCNFKTEDVSEKTYEDFSWYDQKPIISNETENEIDSDGEAPVNESKNGIYSSVKSIKRRRTSSPTQEDPRIQEAYEIMKKCTPRDECSTFGEHIAMRLRKFDRKMQTILMNELNSVVFNAEMEYYDNENISSLTQFPGTSNSPASQLTTTAIHNNTELYYDEESCSTIID